MSYDVAVIGGGPAGLMAAISASENGAKVVLLEKNKRLGLKLLITGGGRCNITNYIDDYKLLAASYGPKGKFLLSAFSRFGAQEIINFFEDLGLKTKIEKNNQVFPQSNRSQDVLNILMKRFLQLGGEIKIGRTVKKIIVSNNSLEKIVLLGGEEIIARNYILATGGRSYPVTGATGDGYLWLESLGHKIIPLRPTLSPIIVREKIVKELEGLSLNKAGLLLQKDGKKVVSLIGDLIFTANGLSGPVVLNLSRYLDYRPQDFRLFLDFFPEIDENELDQKLQELFKEQGQKDIKNSLLSLLPPKLVPVILKFINIPLDCKGNGLSKINRQALAKLLKGWSFTVSSVAGYERAMVTAGGLDLKEVAPRTMQSKLVSNLFIAGELLDLDGPTGGYNLQICWSTGYVAGQAAANGKIN